MNPSQRRRLRDFVFQTLINLLVILTPLLWVVPLAGVYQEYKLWSSNNHKSSSLKPLNLIGILNVYVFNLVWILAAGFGSLAILPLYYLNVYKNNNIDYYINTIVEKYTGIWCILLVCDGVELNFISKNQKLPQNCIIAANHNSQLDIGCAYFLDTTFKWISKRSVVFMPGVGSVMLLGQHILLDRISKNSIATMYEQANTYLKDQKSTIFIFPQGTRCMSHKKPFKNGAFNMAIAAQVPIVPVSIDISVNNHIWNESLFIVNLLQHLLSFIIQKKKEKKKVIHITVHNPINVDTNSDREVLKKQCEDAIYRVLADDCRKQEHHHHHGKKEKSQKKEKILDEGDTVDKKRD